VQPAPDDWEALVEGLRTGRADALRRFVGRFSPALERIARRAIAPGMRRRFGAESVAQSVCRTFLRRAGDGQFELADQDRVWSLLCAIALTKVRERTRYHLRRRRRVDREAPLASVESGDPAVVDPAPTPEDLAAFEEGFAAALASLDDEERRILELRLEEKETAQIAAELGVSARTVRRRLAELEERLRESLAG
jgi:RNA polymerase sigma factor (sigma-70 family)